MGILAFDIDSLNPGGYASCLKQRFRLIDAVKNGRVVSLNDAYLSRPGPRLIDGLEQMAKLIHPELFP